MFGLEPVAIAAVLVRASGRDLDPADQREAQARALAQAVFRQQAQVTDSRDAAEGLEPARYPFAQVVATHVRQFARKGEMMGDAIGYAQRAYEIIVGVVGIDAAAGERRELSVRTVLR